MSDQSKLAVVLVLVLGAFLAFAYVSSGSSNKNFGKVIKEYQTHGKTHQFDPEDIKKGFQ